MEIKDLSKSQGRKVIRKLIEEGRITPRMVEEIIADIPSEEMMRLVDAVHILFCKSNHDTDCSYYKNEAAGEGAWQEGTHKDWIEETVRLMNVIGTEAVDIMSNVVVSVATALHDVGPAGERLLEELISRSEPSETPTKSDQ